MPLGPVDIAAKGISKLTVRLGGYTHSETLCRRAMNRRRVEVVLFCEAKDQVYEFLTKPIWRIVVDSAALRYMPSATRTRRRPAGLAASAFRSVALRDLVERQFDGHPYAARRGIGVAERRGWVRRRKARGPQGGEFTVVVATAAGSARAATLWCEAGRADQRTFSGAVKPSEIGHDVAVYRAAGSALGMFAVVAWLLAEMCGVR